MALFRTKDGLLMEVIIDSREMFGQSERYLIHSPLNADHQILVLSSRCTITDQEREQFPLDRLKTMHDRVKLRSEYLRTYKSESGERERIERIEAMTEHDLRCAWHDTMYGEHWPCDCGFENPRRLRKQGEQGWW